MTNSIVGHGMGWLLWALAGAAAAAGGHHAVDDAVILEPGRCEADSWLSRRDGDERLLRTGLGCRVGPVELGLAGERTEAPDGGQTGYSPQLKWAAALTPSVAAGFSVSPGWVAQARPRYQGTTIAGLVTWKASPQWALHLNIGRDVLRGSPDQDRSGLSAEWTPHPHTSLVAELYTESESRFARAGVRWVVAESWRLDLSRAQRLRGPASSSWTAGVTWAFGRD